MPLKIFSCFVFEEEQEEPSTNEQSSVDGKVQTESKQNMKGDGQEIVRQDQQLVEKQREDCPKQMQGNIEEEEQRMKLSKW